CELAVDIARHEKELILSHCGTHPLDPGSSGPCNHPRVRGSYRVCMRTCSVRITDYGAVTEYRLRTEYGVRSCNLPGRARYDLMWGQWLENASQSKPNASERWYPLKVVLRG